MSKYIKASNLAEATEIKDRLVRAGKPNAWIQTLAKDKEYRVHAGTLEEIVRFSNKQNPFQQ